MVEKEGKNCLGLINNAGEITLIKYKTDGGNKSVILFY